MIVRHPGRFPPGYTILATSDGPMGLEFGILRLEAGEASQEAGGVERAFHLIQGSVALTWDGERARRVVTRRSMLEEQPSALHVPAGSKVKLEGLHEESGMGGGAELAVIKVPNGSAFAPRLYLPVDIESARLSPPLLNGTAEREIRTVVDDTSAPLSAMTFGELVNLPGRWSSYPPHHHPQPELYHFRFFPEGGFGYSEQGEDVYKVGNGDTALIPPGLSHPQTSAPGYSMVYIWAIRHLAGHRFLANSRVYLPQHSWTNG